MEPLKPFREVRAHTKFLIALSIVEYRCNWKIVVSYHSSLFILCKDFKSVFRHPLFSATVHAQICYRNKFFRQKAKRTKNVNPQSLWMSKIRNSTMFRLILENNSLLLSSTLTSIEAQFNLNVCYVTEDCGFPWLR